MTAQPDTPETPFRLEEATIGDLHAAIKAGQITVVEVVERYLERVRTYNGVASMLVTGDGMPVRPSRSSLSRDLRSSFRCSICRRFSASTSPPCWIQRSRVPSSRASNHMPWSLQMSMTTPLRCP